MNEPITYEKSGVDYSALDAFKISCQKAAAATSHLLSRFNYREVLGIRGESAFVFETSDRYIAHVEEGLGTKNIIADELLKAGINLYYNIGLDTVATIVNDLITVGALPLSVAMHLAVGDNSWFENGRGSELVRGFAEGCKLSGAVWGGGETPTLKDLVHPEHAVIGGSAIGEIFPKKNFFKGDIAAGDKIIFIESSGVHTNGLTLCRAIKDRLVDGYKTKLSNGRCYGEELLTPSIIYAKFIEECHKNSLKINYCSHITGHGFRKLMRLDRPFVYQIEQVSENPPIIFDFIAQNAQLKPYDAYGTFNMGVGFAVFVHPEFAKDIINVGNNCGYKTWLGGRVLTENNLKEVRILEHNLVFKKESLKIR